MKKLISVLLALISVICITFAFAACGDNESAEKGNVSPVTDTNQNSGNDKKLEEGKFYTVTEAYENGYLTREDVMSIAYYQNGGIQYNESIMDENYMPLPKTPEKPTEETKEAIINSFYNSEYWEQYKNYWTKEDIKYSYYGTYGKAVVVMICVGIEAVGDEVGKDTIDGITIYYTNTKRLSVWISNILDANYSDFADDCVLLMLDDDYDDIDYIRSIFKNYSIEDIRNLTPSMDINIYRVDFSFHDKKEILKIIDLFSDTEGVRLIEPNYIMSID